MIELVAQSESMREALRLAERVAVTDANVLITGESGTGKDALAFFIHSRSKRAAGRLVKIDCAALPTELLEAELFGYERGAFTGATESKPGRLEAAHEGTLVLDEIALLSTDAQAKLLRVIEHREFERLGSRGKIKVDARLIALTNVDLEAAVKRRDFREDLFYRLNVVRVHLEPLRDRVEDIPELADRMLKAYSSKHGRRLDGFAPDALAAIRAYEFPGNARELANTVERAVIVSNGSRVEMTDLPEVLQAVRSRGKRSGRLTLAEVEAAYVRETLAAARGNKSEAARLLGISRKNLYEKLSRYERSKDDGEGSVPE